MSFCFTKTVSGGDKYIVGNAVYHITNDNDEFREITFRGLIGNSELLIMTFERNTFLFMLTLVQMVPILSPDAEYVPTPSDLPNSSPLLLYTATIVPDSYLLNTNGGIESFMLTQHLYDSITNNKQIPQKLLSPAEMRISIMMLLKTTLKKKTVLSVIGRLKIRKSCSHEALDMHLDNIEETYASL
ncbi:10699_t:CDS:2 [Gigaspora margarita]|uniref:10699_t:CDS:1 n=1 Tax=Gigaspora margarita TaxID=4874 RepID=A0ABM8VZ88_GIGMA|nr:10699_t:CDS:2 [Gigaspora margarita]